MSTQMPKGFIEVNARCHTDPATSMPENIHLINVAHIIVVEKTEHDRARLKLNGYWIETDMTYDNMKTMIREAMA